MGTFTYPLEVISRDGSRSETVDATVDTGSTYTCLPATLLCEFGIVPLPPYPIGTAGRQHRR
ncbi:MAG: hypothetical protein OXI54_09325 [Chloroflexota bacterium]|nr:hypothetical protein [Chloroflexota bacterium]